MSITEFQRRCCPVSAQQVHRRRAHEASDELVTGPHIKLGGRAELLHAALVKNRDLVGQCHGFDLIMRDINNGGAKPVMKPFDFCAHLRSQLRIQVRQWLVKEEDFGISDNGAANGHPLALPARQGCRFAAQQVLDAQQACSIIHPPGDFCCRRFAQLKAEGHVLPDRLVGIQGIVLEHHRNVPLSGRNMVDLSPIDLDDAFADVLKAGDHPQQCGFSATRWPDKHHQLAIGHLYRDIIDCEIGPVIGFSNRLDIDAGH